MHLPDFCVGIVVRFELENSFVIEEFSNSTYSMNKVKDVKHEEVNAPLLNMKYGTICFIKFRFI